MQKVGLLVPFYNQEKYVKEALESYFNQEQKHCQISVYFLDDFSTDNTQQVLKEVLPELRKSRPYDFIWCNPEIKRGCFGSYNLLAKIAIRDGCDFVMPCGGDDIMEKTCISTALSYFDRDIDLQALDMPCKTFGIESGIVFRPQPQATYESAWNQNPWTSFILYRAELWNQYNGYDTSLTPKHIQTGIEDCEFHLRLLKDKVKVGFMDEVLYNYRVHETQSHRHAAPYLGELYEIIKKKHGRV